MGIVLTIEIAVFITILTVGTLAIKHGIESYKVKKMSQIIDEEINEISLKASKIYADILENQKIINGDKIDLSILISCIEIIDDELLYKLTGLSKEKILNEIRYDLPDLENEIENNPLIEKRIDMYENLRYTTRLKWDANSLIIEMMNFSNTCQKVFYACRRVKENQKKEETIFYNHSYPEDTKIKILTKK